MFEEEERILRADGKARGTEIGNKIYGEWFATAKKHAKLNLDGGEVQMLDTTREVVTFLLRMDDNDAYMGEDYEYTQGEFLRHTEKIFFLMSNHWNIICLSGMVIYHLKMDTIKAL